MKICQRFHSQSQRFRFQIQKVSTFQTIVRNEMEVISRNTEGTRKAGRPQSHQSSGNIAKVELALRFGGVDQACTGFGWIDCPSANSFKLTVYLEGVKNVARLSLGITAFL